MCSTVQLGIFEAAELSLLRFAPFFGAKRTLLRSILRRSRGAQLTSFRSILRRSHGAQLTLFCLILRRSLGAHFTSLHFCLRSILRRRSAQFDSLDSAVAPRRAQLTSIRSILLRGRVA
jgi:hypothetical protein